MHLSPLTLPRYMFPNGLDTHNLLSYPSQDAFCLTRPLTDLWDTAARPSSETEFPAEHSKSKLYEILRLSRECIRVPKNARKGQVGTWKHDLEVAHLYVAQLPDLWLGNSIVAVVCGEACHEQPLYPVAEHLIIGHNRSCSNNDNGQNKKLAN